MPINADPIVENRSPPSTIPNIAVGESQTLAFKSSFDKAAIESLVAFANAQGGTVLVGVSDSGAVQGVSSARKRSTNG